MRLIVNKKILVAAAASTSLLGLVGYPTLKSTYPIKKEATVIDDYVDLPTATTDLTDDIIMPEGAGSGTDIQLNLSHWLLLSLLKSKYADRRIRTLRELAHKGRWNDAVCQEIAQALDRRDIIKLARTPESDLRLFLPPPSVDFIQGTLKSNKIDKLVKTILKEVSEQLDTCSSCTNFYTNLSIRVRPTSDVFVMNDLNQVDKSLRIESRKRKKSSYNEDVIRLKAVLNNVICGEQQALSMSESGMLVALLYYRHKYTEDVQISSLLAQILANLSTHQSTKEFIFVNGWIQSLVEFVRSDHLEVSLPAAKALANLDEDSNKTYGHYENHLYLLSPIYDEPGEADFDIVFLHGLVGSIFKSWRQGSVVLDDRGNRKSSKNFTPTTELLPISQEDLENTNVQLDAQGSESRITKCWPKDWLSEDVPGLRILAVDYPTALSNWRTDCDLNKDTLKERATHVIKQLENAKLGERPIIWIAHSMGGLLVKQILVTCYEHLKLTPPNGLEKNSRNLSREILSKILNQTKGVVFYSVPHRGSNLDWIERKNLQKLLLLTTEVIELQKDSPVLLELHDKFIKFIREKGSNIKFLTFAEDSVSSFGTNKVVQWKGVLVHPDSLQFEVGPVYKLDIDHANTCKPSSKNSITYLRTLDFIRDLVPTQAKQKDEDMLPLFTFTL